MTNGAGVSGLGGCWRITNGGAGCWAISDLSCLIIISPRRDLISFLFTNLIFIIIYDFIFVKTYQVEEVLVVSNIELILLG